MKINPLTDYYRSAFFFVPLRGIINYPSMCTQSSYGVEAKTSTLFLSLCLVLCSLLAFASKEASFLRDLDSSYTVSCVCTGL